MIAGLVRGALLFAAASLIVRALGHPTIEATAYLFCGLVLIGNVHEWYRRDAA